MAACVVALWGGLSLPASAAGQQAVRLPEFLLVTGLGGEVAARPTLSPFLRSQLEFPRVRAAWEKNSGRLGALFEEADVEGAVEVYLRVFKREQELEVWARSAGQPRFRRLRTYPVCRVSGELGPKRTEGDEQVPEGFYAIDLLNPRSDYHLSLRVDYPNAVDRARGAAGALGGDIYIHGGCSTIGCVPVTDDWIEELYLIAIAAREAGQRTIPVHIFPTRLDDVGFAWLRESFGEDHRNVPFWENLREGYEAFERSRTLPTIRSVRGRYVIDKPAPRSLGRPLPASR